MVGEKAERAGARGWFAKSGVDRQRRKEQSTSTRTGPELLTWNWAMMSRIVRAATRKFPVVNGKSRRNGGEGKEMTLLLLAERGDKSKIATRRRHAA